MTAEKRKKTGALEPFMIVYRAQINLIDEWFRQKTQKRHKFINSDAREFSGRMQFMNSCVQRWKKSMIYRKERTGFCRWKKKRKIEWRSINAIKAPTSRWISRFRLSVSRIKINQVQFWAAIKLHSPDVCQAKPRGKWRTRRGDIANDIFLPVGPARSC